VRARFTRGARLGVRPGGPDDQHVDEEFLAVLFMEELRTVLARQREERLVAMGRISAGIAHEIRNPLAAVSQANALLQEDLLRPDQQRLVRIVADNVERLRRIVEDVMEAAPGSTSPSRTIDATAEVAAISQANALLEEDPLSPDQHRLTRMVAENAERLKRIVDDVLEVAPGTAPVHRVIDGTAEVAKVCSEWARTAQLPLGESSRLRVKLPAQPVGVVFEPEHLRRVLVNLLDNARRHGSEAAGAVRLELKALDERRAVVVVGSDGPPIPPEVEQHLFEPFFSTRSRGTGLGLYICKELCERYGATIEYRPGSGPDSHPNVFRVEMQRSPLALTESTLLT
jgi:two-component system sensor histidine kinase PilS (NtrC family)